MAGRRFATRVSRGTLPAEVACVCARCEDEGRQYLDSCKLTLLASSHACLMCAVLSMCHVICAVTMGTWRAVP